MKQEAWGRAAFLGGQFLAPSLQHWASSNLAWALVGGGVMLQHNWLQNKNLGGFCEKFQGLDICFHAAGNSPGSFFFVF